MNFRKGPRCAFAAEALLFASAFLCASAVAQSATPESDASTHSKTTASVQSHSDIFSPSYVPPPQAKHRQIPTPVLVYSVDPQFPADAPQGKFSGFVVVATVVDTSGKPEHVHVVKSLGPEFDKNAVAAVEQYRFRPALQSGKPVPVKVNVEVNFRRY